MQCIFSHPDLKKTNLYSEHYVSEKCERFVNKIWCLDNGRGKDSTENKLVLPNGCFNLAFEAETLCIALFFTLPKTKEGLLIFTTVDDGYKVYEKLLLHYLGKNEKKLIDIETK